MSVPAALPRSTTSLPPSPPNVARMSSRPSPVMSAAATFVKKPRKLEFGRVCSPVHPVGVPRTSFTEPSTVAGAPLTLAMSSRPSPLKSRSSTDPPGTPGTRSASLSGKTLAPAVAVMAQYATSSAAPRTRIA